MTDLTSVYADVEAEARAHWWAERPDAESGDDSPGFDESRLCTVCEHGHGGHVCAWCSGAVS